MQVKEHEDDLRVIIQRPIVYPIDWTEHDQSTPIDDFYDIILLTDCIFSALLTNDLVKTIQKFSNSKTKVICCHEIRDEVIMNYLILRHNYKLGSK